MLGDLPLSSVGVPVQPERVARARWDGHSVNGEPDRLRTALTAAITGPGRGRAAADRLCAAAVALLPIDGAALSLRTDGADLRSVGAGGAVTDEVDELEFTLGEGPCADVVSSGEPVLAADLNGPDGQRWPAFADAAIGLGLQAVFAFPVTVAGFPAGVLWFCRQRPGPLMGHTLTGAFLAAELAVLPLLDVFGIDLHAGVTDETSDAWDELGSLTRSEVYQAAGTLIAQLGVSPMEAMMRLRAHAFATGLTASDVAYQILDRSLHLGDDDASDHEPRREDFS